MASRLCGYCREGGHRADKCPVREDHRNTVLTHTPKERKFILDTLPKLGFGLGAMFLIKDWYRGSNTSVTLIDHNWIKYQQFVNFKRVKYSKQIRLNPTESFTRIGNEIMGAANQYGMLNISGLSIADGTSTMTGHSVRYASLVGARELDPTTELKSGMILLVSPSDTPFDYTREDICCNIAVHKRISDVRPPSKWDDIVYETGRLP